MNEHMETAFKLAEEALKNDEVPVGCVFVCDGVQVGQGRNEVNASGDPTAHAEMVAIREMRKHNWSEKEIHTFELFVTLEPCIMCAAAMYELGIKRIVYGAANQRFGGIESVGNKEKYGAEHEIEVNSLIEANRAIGLLKQFYELENANAPEQKKEDKKKRNC
ncbi:unnamed protein product, partial [Mesorhabditis belari]|uniref:CMP/dCMP-type deaminase domain-containing protein n=1 Tax=Mesorhabditis belari TaxID=2138241 RepID=A0AAF3FNM7_9BILA